MTAQPRHFITHSDLSLCGGECMPEGVAMDPNACPSCGDHRDGPDADCANCGYVPPAPAPADGLREAVERLPWRVKTGDVELVRRQDVLDLIDAALGKAPR